MKISYMVIGNSSSGVLETRVSVQEQLTLVIDKKVEYYLII